jgi:hypothetical protein
MKTLKKKDKLKKLIKLMSFLVYEFDDSSDKKILKLKVSKKKNRNVFKFFYKLFLFVFLTIGIKFFYDNDN